MRSKYSHGRGVLLALLRRRISSIISLKIKSDEREPSHSSAIERQNPWAMRYIGPRVSCNISTWMDGWMDEYHIFPLWLVCGRFDFPLQGEDREVDAVASVFLAERVRLRGLPTLNIFVPQAVLKLVGEFRSDLINLTSIDNLLLEALKESGSAGLYVGAGQEVDGWMRGKQMINTYFPHNKITILSRESHHNAKVQLQSSLPWYRVGYLSLFHVVFDAEVVCPNPCYPGFRISVKTSLHICHGFLQRSTSHRRTSKRMSTNKRSEEDLYQSPIPQQGVVGNASPAEFPLCNFSRSKSTAGETTRPVRRVSLVPSLLVSTFLLVVAGHDQRSADNDWERGYPASSGTATSWGGLRGWKSLYILKVWFC
jgi:hypothetical protein